MCKKKKCFLQNKLLYTLKYKKKKNHKILALIGYSSLLYASGAINRECEYSVSLSKFYYSYIFYFFLQKQNDIHSFKLIEYIRDNNMINIAKNVKGESAKKLTAPKLIAYSGKMPTNNMIKSKSPEYSCFWICNVDAQIID